jgi:hypothetical protein
VIPGVHAETIAFTSYEQARSLVLARGWPWIGTAGQLGGRDVELQGTRQRRFRVRVTDLRERGKTMSCQLELYDIEHLFAPLMKVELSFVPDIANTRVSLRGSTGGDLTPASSMQAAMSRGLANEYARALLDQIAKAMEERSGGGSPASQSRADAGLRKRR